MKMEVKGKAYEVEISETGPGTFHVIVDGTTYDVRVPDGQGRRVSQVEASRAAPSPSARGPETGPACDGHVLSPLPGVVVKILVGQGEAVKTGQPLVMLESMKMNVPVTAHRNGTVGRILVKDGESLQVGQKVLELG